MSPIMITDDDRTREPGCSCHQEEGDSPCSAKRYPSAVEVTP